MVGLVNNGYFTSTSFGKSSRVGSVDAYSSRKNEIMWLNKALKRTINSCFTRSGNIASCSYSALDRKIVPRSEEFYEESGIKKREYYYVMDLRGQLFVENVKRSIATSMKDVKFLDFMYKNLRYNDTNINKEIPLLTYCGKEKNFVTPIDQNSVLVFKDLIQSKDAPNGYILTYGGTLQQNFDPSKLAFSNETGRIYHELLNHKNLCLPNSIVYGLLHVNITAQYFSNRLIYNSGDGTDTGITGTNTDTTTGMSDKEDKLQLNWDLPDPDKAQLYDIKII